MKISSGTIARTIILVLALVNQALVMVGKSPLPIENAEVESFITMTITIVASMVAWWKNNSFTEKAIAADRTFK